MSDQQHLQTVIRHKTRRLQKLKEQEAVTGPNTAPEVLIQIEDLETELAELQIQREALGRAPVGRETEEPPALVHIHVWGQRPATFPEQAVVFDWNGPGLFEEPPDRARTLPSPEVWTTELAPPLFDLPQQERIRERAAVRLEGRCALSVGFAFGHIFRAKTRYRLEVAQYVPGKGLEIWRAGQTPPDPGRLPEFTHNIVRPDPALRPEGPAPADGAIIVHALSRVPLPVMVEEVGRYFGEAEAFSRILEGEGRFESVKGVLLLAAEATATERRQLEGWEASALADSSRWYVKEFIGQVKPARLHLFLAAPLGLAVFLGHYWETIRKPVQCYEEVGHETVYRPVFEFRLN